MKKLAIATASVFLMGLPAFAQQQVWSPGDGTMQPVVSGMTQPMEPNEGTEAFAAYRGAGSVVVDGEVVGNDPDANIRLQLQRDQPGMSND